MKYAEWSTQNTKQFLQLKKNGKKDTQRIINRYQQNIEPPQKIYTCYIVILEKQDNFMSCKTWIIKKTATKSVERQGLLTTCRDKGGEF